MRWMLMLLLMGALATSPALGSEVRETTLTVPSCDATAMTKAVGTWLAAQAGGADLALVRKAAWRGRPAPARLRVRVLATAIERQVIPVEVEVLREGAAPERISLTWRRNGAPPLAAGVATGGRGTPVTLVSRVGLVEVEAPGRTVSATGPDGRVRVVNPKTGRLLQGRFLAPGRVLVEGRLAP